MKFKIKETGEIKELSIYDPKTGMDWTSDFIGNHGGFDNGDFVRDGGDEIYIVDKENFEWWEDIMEGYQDADNRLHKMKQEMDYDEREKFEMFLTDYTGCDLVWLPGCMNLACDDWEDMKDN